MNKYVPKVKGTWAVCILCKKNFTRGSGNHKICNENCRREFYGRNSTIKIASASVGSISEMMICSEMLARGYSVFRTVSSASFCDVVAVKGDETLFLEVRTGYKDLKGKVLFPKPLHSKIAMPTHYGVYIPKSKEIYIAKITDEEKNVHSYQKRLERSLIEENPLVRAE